MKFEMDKIKTLADAIEIEFSEQELDLLMDSLDELTTKLDDLLEIDVNSEAKTCSSKQSNVFNDKCSNEDNLEFMKSVNNFDGKYVSVRKVINNEE